MQTLVGGVPQAKRRLHGVPCRHFEYKRLHYRRMLRRPFLAPIHLPRLPQGFLVPLPRLACCSVEQFVYLDWLIRSKPFEKGVHIRIGQHHLPVFGPKEAILYGPVEQGQ